MDVGYPAALFGGLLALLSPCSALLLPSFFAYAFRDTVGLLARTAVFYAGMCATLVPLGAGSAMVSGFFHGNRDLLITVAGWIVILFGLAQILGLGVNTGPIARLQGRLAGRTGALSVFGLGAVYGLAGFCSGPILGAVLTVAATGGTIRGGLLLTCYALGMALPLFVLALFWDRFDLGRRPWLRGRSFAVGPLTLHTTSLVSGLLFVVIGTLFLFYDGTASLPNLLGPGEEIAHRLQLQLAQLGGAADLLFVAAAALVLFCVGLHRLRRGRSSVEEAPAEEEQEGRAQ